MSTLFLITLILFVLFIIYQIYFYSSIYKKNEDTLKKVESFQSTLLEIDTHTDYLLDDSSEPEYFIEVAYRMSDKSFNSVKINEDLLNSYEINS